MGGYAWSLCLGEDGKRKEALQAMDEGTLKFAGLTWTVTSTTADFYALQGDHAKAIEWLQLAIARGDERVSYFRRNPRLSTLRNDPRFQSLLNSVEARPSPPTRIVGPPHASSPSCFISLPSPRPPPPLPPSTLPPLP